MRKLAFNICALISLALCLGAATIWTYSYWEEYGIRFSRYLLKADRTPQASVVVSSSILRGGIAFELCRVRSTGTLYGRADREDDSEWLDHKLLESGSRGSLDHKLLAASLYRATDCPPEECSASNSRRAVAVSEFR